MRLFTIGFTKKNAREFFTKLVQSGVKRVVDVRLKNTSGLSGFSKKDDLKYFLEKIGPIEYVHLIKLAPTADILDDFKKRKGLWSNYETGFLTLMKQRHIEDRLRGVIHDGDCLLCSEDTPEHCHRRLVVEYLNEKWGDIEVNHIV